MYTGTTVFTAMNAFTLKQQERFLVFVFVFVFVFVKLQVYARYRSTINGSGCVLTNHFCTHPEHVRGVTTVVAVVLKPFSPRSAVYHSIPPLSRRDSLSQTVSPMFILSREKEIPWCLPEKGSSTGWHFGLRCSLRPDGRHLNRQS
jgi:hypothetical protein